MTILNFMLDHLGTILILSGMAIIVLILWAFWEDVSEANWEDKLNTKPVFPPVCKAAHVPAQHAPQFKKPLQEVKTAFHHAALAPEIKAAEKPHPKPKKH